MRKIVVKLHTGYCGEDVTDIIEVKDSVSDETLDQWAQEMAYENADMYGRELCTDDCEDDDCEHEHPGMSNIEGSWEDYDPEKHDYLT